MEYGLVWLYVLMTAAVWRTLQAWEGDDLRFVAALFWPVTLLTVVAFGLLLVPLCLLPVLGYVNASRGPLHRSL